jgi:DNA-binding IclR family transcriptional regulator
MGLVTTSDTPSARPGGVQSVDRAVAILDVLAERSEAGVTEIASAIGVHKSTASRLLASLEGGRLVEQTTHRGSYRLGSGLLRLAAPVSGRMDVTREGRPVLEALAGEVGETVNLAVLRGTDVVNLEQVRGPATITTVNWVGQPTPLHATSGGKVLLAALAPDDLAAFLARPLPRFTPETITERPALEHELARVREQGYATTTEELEQGLDAVAAPVRDAGGHVVAAITVSGPVYRFDAARMAEVAPAVVAAGADLSRRLGYAPSTDTASSPS